LEAIVGKWERNAGGKDGKWEKVGKWERREGKSWKMGT